MISFNPETYILGADYNKIDQLGFRKGRGAGEAISIRAGLIRMLREIHTNKRKRIVFMFYMYKQD